MSLSPFLVLTQEKETKESQAPAGGIFFVRCRLGKVCLGGCELLLFVRKMKIGGVFLAPLSPFLVLTQEKEAKESQAPAGGVFFVRCRSEKSCLGGDGLLLFVGKMKIGGVFLVSLPPFLVLTQEKETKESQAPAGGGFFVRCRSGKGCLGGGVLLLSIDIVWKGIWGLGDVGRDRK